VRIWWLGPWISHGHQDNDRDRRHQCDEHHPARAYRKFQRLRRAINSDLKLQQTVLPPLIKKHARVYYRAETVGSNARRLVPQQSAKYMRLVFTYRECSEPVDISLDLVYFVTS